MNPTEDSLEILMVKATSPISEDQNAWVRQFCEKAKTEFEGVQLAARLLAYRIHSPLEIEALNALKLLEECVKSCGQPFRNEIGKFRFLNEMIKLVSPKYLGHRTPVSIKKKVVELLYTWARELHGEPKIKEAYDMLKKQNIVVKDPDFTPNTDTAVSSSTSRTEVPTKPVPSTFTDSGKSQLLEQLLKSKNPEDLQAANRLIKSMVKEDELRMEKNRLRRMELQTVENNIKLFAEMMDNMETSASSREDFELVKEVNDNCRKLKARLLNLASETDDTDDALGEILKACDELDLVLARYTTIVMDNQVGQKRQAMQSSCDLLLDQSVSIPANRESLVDQRTLDEPLLLLEFEGINLKSSNNLLPPTKVQTQPQPAPGMKSVSGNVGFKGQSHYKSAGLQELDSLSESMLREYLPSYESEPKVCDKLPMNQWSTRKASIPVSDSPAASYKLVDCTVDDPSTLLVSVSASNGADAELIRTEENLDFLQGSTENLELANDEALLNDICNGQNLGEPAPLGDLSLYIEDVTPDSRPPVVLLDNPKGLSVTLHLARDRPRSDVATIVVSALSRYEHPLLNLAIQVLVPDFCRFKLLPITSSSLPAFKPFLPPPAVTQILLIACPSENPVSLRFLVSFEISGETVSKMCESPNFHLV